MNKYSAVVVRKRIEYIRYIFKSTEEFPTAFENFAFPVAAYDKGGTIVGANKAFRELALISEDDICHEKANVLECFCCENAGLAEAAHAAFENTEKICPDLGCSLHTRAASGDYLLAMFPNAIFFPMSYDHGAVRYGAVLLDRRDYKEVVR